LPSPPELVIAVAAVELIVPLTAVEVVGACPAAEAIVAPQTEDDVVAAEADNNIVARRALQHIIALGADNGGRLAKAGDLRPHVSSDGPARHQDKEANQPSLASRIQACLPVLHPDISSCLHRSFPPHSAIDSRP
jgi:hypothetical protein